MTEEAKRQTIEALRERCPRRSECPNPAQEPHLCPYQKDVNDDHETLCTCCGDCEQECSEDI